jgi:hypothetical protein
MSRWEEGGGGGKAGGVESAVVLGEGVWRSGVDGMGG